MSSNTHAHTNTTARSVQAKPKVAAVVELQRQDHSSCSAAMKLKVVTRTIPTNKVDSLKQALKVKPTKVVDKQKKKQDPETPVPSLRTKVKPSKVIIGNLDLKKEAPVPAPRTKVKPVQVDDDNLKPTRKAFTALLKVVAKQAVDNTKLLTQVQTLRQNVNSLTTSVNKTVDALDTLEDQFTKIASTAPTEELFFPDKQLTYVEGNVLGEGANLYFVCV